MIIKSLKTKLNTYKLKPYDLTNQYSILGNLIEIRAKLKI